MHSKSSAARSANAASTCGWALRSPWRAGAPSVHDVDSRRIRAGMSPPSRASRRLARLSRHAAGPRGVTRSTTGHPTARLRAWRGLASEIAHRLLPVLWILLSAFMITTRARVESCRPARPGARIHGPFTIRRARSPRTAYAPRDSYADPHENVAPAVQLSSPTTLLGRQYSFLPTTALECSPSALRRRCESAHLHDRPALVVVVCSLRMTTFSCLRSRWTIPRAWACLREAGADAYMPTVRIRGKGRPTRSMPRVATPSNAPSRDRAGVGL